ncbi:MAG: efflux RND transporter periplasmic adaptor subunit [Rhizobiales bacterium]|nr:efflux RND transporter periplasmic adaptor subunit [Hyphomicrobiales bacterium]
MLRRIIYFFLVTVIFGGLAALIAWYAFDFKPKMIAQVIMSSPPPVETISAEAAREETWQPRILALGTLTAVNGIDVTPEVGGVVREIYFESGQKVKKGDKLVQLDTDTLDADLRNFELQLENAQTELDRRKKIFDKGFAAKADLDTATVLRDRLQANIDRTKAEIAQKAIYAPWDGTLGLRKISVGKYVAAGDPLVWLQSVDPIFVDFTVTEADFGRLKPGQAINATFTAYPGEQFRGEIATTDAKIDASSRMITVRGQLANPGGRLVPGMYANVAVDAGEPEKVVTVAQTAVTYSLYGDSVFVLAPPKGETGEGKDEVFDVERHFVKLGAIREGRIQIVDGLKSGDRVVIAGQNKIDHGSKVRVDNSVALNAPADRSTQ